MIGDWKEVKLKSVFSFHNGKKIKPNSEGSFIAYGSNGRIGHSEKPLFEHGIIIGRVGAYCGSIFMPIEPFWASDNTIVVKVKDGFDQTFMSYCLGLMDLNQYSGGSAQPLLTHGWLKPLKIKLPPLPTQSKIASILSAYDDLIENNLKRIKLLEEKAQLTYEEWFVRMKFPGHETTPIDEETGLPEGWKKTTIGEVIEVGRGSSPRPIADQKYFDGGDIPWLKIADATASNIFIYETKQYVNELGASYSRKLPIGSIVVAASGTLGFPMILGVEACIHDGWLYFRGIKDELKEYFYYSFICLRKYFESISYGAAIQNINTGIVRQSPFIVPDENTSIAFKGFASRVFKNIDNLQKQNQLLKEARDILLPRLMTGMIDVEKLDLSAFEVGDQEGMMMAAEPSQGYKSKNF